MKLTIPHFKQERGLSCGLAALRMVFSYYQNGVNERELVKNVKIHSFGTFMTDLGYLALNRGYRVTTYTFHLPLLAPLKLKFGAKVNEEHTRKIKIRPSDRMTFNSWQKYLKVGGMLIWEPPQISQIEHWIGQEAPCIINVNTAALNRYWRNWDNGHVLVVNNFEDKKISILDPDLPENKAKYKIENDLLLPAWAINAKRSSGYLMVIRKKK